MSLATHAKTEVLKVGNINVLGGVGGTTITGVACASADSDSDGDVDLADYRQFQNCFGTDGAPVSELCMCLFDINGDSFVDLGDLPFVIGLFTGPQ